MLREIRDLGFEYAELSHGIRISLLPGILEAVEAGEIKISSLHNYCPLPMGVSHAAPNIFQFSSADKRERENAFRHSIKTIELAARVNARAVVLHVGRIDMKEFTDKLLESVQKGNRETERYADLCETMMGKRERHRRECTEASIEMVRRLIPKAEELGIKLGVENREKVEEIPVEMDFGLILQELNHPGVGYWHDMGHAQIKENLGFLNHAMFLESLADRLVGFHVHDVQFPGRDHCAPGTGMINYASLTPMVKPEHLKVFELSPRLEVEEVRRGVEHIFQIWGKE